MPRIAVMVVAALLVPALARTAHAGGPPGTTEALMPAEAPPERRTVHYGYQTFLADGAWVLATAAIARSDSTGDGAGTVVMLGYYGAAPIVHLANHNRDGALKSLGLRVLLPVAGAVGGLVLASDGDGDDDGMAPIFGMMAGLGIGALSAMVIDWTVLSKRSIEVPRPALSGFTPGVKIGKQEVQLSLSGSF
jgi:hypothetical protein